LIAKVSRHCEANGTRGRTVTLKVKYADFQQITRSRTVGVARQAMAARFPLNAARDNFERFLKKNGMLAKIEDIPAVSRRTSGHNIGGA
jgi:nucleotidyltransferase/DNA polymerase involved in DNA repair